MEDGKPTQKSSCKVVPLLKTALTQPFPVEFEELTLIVTELFVFDNIIRFDETC